MPEGIERRKDVKSSLSGYNPTPVQFSPVRPSIGPREVSNPYNSYDAQIADQVSKFAMGTVARLSESRRKKSELDGKMAFYQGKTLEDMEMDGDRWALNGYRLVDAQAEASAFLRAQELEIDNGAYELSPDEYRQKFVERSSAIVEGIEDELTAQLVEEQVYGQMQVLADRHLGAHVTFTEGAAFKSLEHGIDTISRDESSNGNLAKFVSGDIPNGLTDTRRKEAVVKGIVRSFDNDNPNAYKVISNMEEFSRANLTSDQLNAIRGSKARYENRRKNLYSEELFNAKNKIVQAAERGELQPEIAVEALVKAYTDYELQVSNQEAGVIYNLAEQGNRFASLREEALLETAITTGNESAIHRIIADSMDRSGVSREVKTNEVGAAIESLQDAGLHDMVGSNVGGTDITLQGLTSATLNFGIDTVVSHFSSDETEYKGVQEILETHSAMKSDNVYTEQEKLHNAQKIAKEVSKGIAAERTAAVKPIIDRLDEQLLQGTLNEEDWARQRDAVMLNNKVARTIAVVKQEAEMLSKVAVRDVRSKFKEDQSRSQVAYMIEVEESVGNFNELAREVSEGNLHHSFLTSAANELYAQIEQSRVRHGQDISPSSMLATTRKVRKHILEATEKSEKFIRNGMVIKQAVQTHTLSELPEDLQARALKENDERIMRYVEGGVAEGSIPESEKMDVANAERLKFLGQQKVIDPRMRRVLNGFLDQGMVDNSGNAKAAYVEAVETYRELYRYSPDLANDYIDRDSIANVQSVVYSAEGGPVEEAIRTLALRDGLVSATRDEFTKNERVNSLISDYVDDYIADQDVGLLQAMFNDRTNFSQYFDMTGGNDVDSEENHEILKSLVISEIAPLIHADSLANPKDLIQDAVRRVSGRTSIISGEIVELPKGKTFAKEFFGAQGDLFSDKIGVYNTAIMDWLRQPSVREQYGFVHDTNFSEFMHHNYRDDDPTLQAMRKVTRSGSIDTILTGVRPFRVSTSPVDGSLVINVQKSDGGYYQPFVIPTREVGELYIKNHKNKLVD